MKFSITKNNLLEALKILSKAVPTRSTMPIISCALFTQKDDIINIRTTDLEISISMNCTIENDNNETGKIAVPFNKLLEITMAMPEGKINFSVSDIGKISISCKQGHYTIMGISHEEFPKEENIKNVKTLTIEANDLINIINSTVYAASKDNLKPILQGVLFNIDKEGFVSVATDGHRLVKYVKKDIHTLDYEGSVVVPTKILTIINNQLDNKKQISMLIGDNHIQVEIENGKITSKIIKENYPDYEGVIPKDNTKTLIVDKTTFTEAIKRVSIFSNKSSRQVSLNITKNTLIISTEDPENITSGKETVDCNYDGEPMTIGYNALYLKEVIQHQGTDEIKIMLKSPLNAGLFLPIEQNDSENKTTLLMPIRLNESTA